MSFQKHSNQRIFLLRDLEDSTSILVLVRKSVSVQVAALGLWKISHRKSPEQKLEMNTIVERLGSLSSKQKCVPLKAIISVVNLTVHPDLLNSGSVKDLEPLGNKVQTEKNQGCGTSFTMTQDCDEQGPKTAQQIHLSGRK